MKNGNTLSDELKTKIVKTLRNNASPRHVPARIIQVEDIPYTFSGKKVETAVTNIVNGRPVTNVDALKNPESLKFYDVPEIKKWLFKGVSELAFELVKPQNERNYLHSREFIIG